ncbi:cyclophilin-like fold protein [Methanobrevibacter sp.]|uniref:cyclophilin-like fold protein n=1 Tax=Methanobrevibacter sp. TaxID=66852 RepID=UPI00388D689F
MSFVKKITLIILLCLFTCSAVSGADIGDDHIILKIDDTVFNVRLENNSATEELIKILEKRNITINATDYGNFEKIGELGFTLPTNDENINTKSGDIVLYQGNKISLFYNPHSWSYTKIGEIENINSTQLKETLGSGDVTFVLSLR